MKTIKELCLGTLALASVCLTGCREDENVLSEAVLASASSLTFEAEQPVPQIITVYADADWVSEAPDWITVEPSAGTCQTDVTVSVSDNIRDGAPDNPRKADLIFKGRTLASMATVAVSQNGDKYRGVRNYTVSEAAAAPDETVVVIPESCVVAVTSKGFVVSDGTSNVYVADTSVEDMAVGNRVSLKGDKGSDAGLPAILSCDEVEVTGNDAVTYPDAEDITSKVDEYAPAERKYVSVQGVLSGTSVEVEGAAYKVNVQDAPESLGLDGLNGHTVLLKGYFAGVSDPFLNIMATEIKSLGIFETIYFTEDFEWLEPWADATSKDTGRTVEDDNLDAYCPQLPTPEVDGVSALQALEDRGYEMLRIWADGKKESECIYLQRNYLKFGKTGYQAGIVLPKITGVPEDVALTFSFDWCPMRQASGKIDPVHLIVVVSDGSDEKTFEIPESGWEDGHRLEWIPASVELEGVTFNDNTRITVKQTEWGVSTANRWFIDNIKLSGN